MLLQVASLLLFLVCMFAPVKPFICQRISESSLTNVFPASLNKLMMRTASEVSDDDVWKVRRKIMRGVLKPAVQRKLKAVQAKLLDKDAVTDSSKKKAPQGLIASAFLISICAVVLRLGGRTAFVNILGLDFMTDSGLKDQVEGFVSYFNGLGLPLQYSLFFSAWLAAKALCIDAATVVLAFSSGVLFGGLLEGTASSVACSSTASLIIFLTSR
jgi:hypothetical protein